MPEPYIISFKKTSFNQLLRLDRRVIDAIIERLLWMARNIESVSHHALTGQWSGSYKLRSGDYRIIYSLEHKNRLIIVESIGHRREVYDE